jgi:hypothetical protein
MNKDIHLLIPYSYDSALSVNSPNHNSTWDFNKELSGLKLTDFTGKAIVLIKKLIKENKWIEEESLDLLTLVKNNS